MPIFGRIKDVKVSGFTFIRNANKLSFPAVQSIRSALPICDEFVVNVGASDDGTLELIKAMNEPKVRIIESRWNERMQVRGFVYAQQTMIAQYNCTGDWAFYLQGDEVVHEDELETIHASMERHLEDAEVETLLFDYYHFWANQATVLDSPGWYRRESRIIRNTIRSISPSDGLFWVVLERNKRGRYPRAALANAHIYHYGYVRSEKEVNKKAKDVEKFWLSDNPDVAYSQIDPATVKKFTGTHPAVMKGWLPEEPVPFEPDPGYRLTVKDKKYRLKKKLENILGLDLCKKHYKLVR